MQVTINRFKTAAAPAASSLIFITRALGQEEHCRDIWKVQEIRGYDVVTKLTNAPDFIKGVNNLHGVTEPIVVSASNSISTCRPTTYLM